MKIGKRVRSSSIIKTSAPIKKVNLTDDVTDWSSWVAATSTRNYLLDDGYLDYLKEIPSNLSRINTNNIKNGDNFVTSIMSQGIKFERKVIDLIAEKVGNSNFVNIGGDINPRSYEKYLKTIQSIKDGIPVIYQGILRNYENRTYGIPDLLIRRDYLSKIITNPPKSVKNNKASKNDNTGYVVVDIKFKTLHFKSDGVHLRNDGPMKAYKAQLCVYNDALNTIQDQKQDSAYLLGWKWKYTRKCTDHSGDNCFDKVGRINYEGPDKEFVNKTARAIEWVRNVRQNGHKWDLTKLPLPHEELYPNMCNRYDYPYHKEKTEFAEKISDISLIWKCGPKQRKIAHSNGIYSWKNSGCDAETLGIGGEFTSSVVNRILEANNNPMQEGNIIPKYIKNNFGNWKNKQNLELFVDFEMTCGVFTEFDDLPYADGESLIFMIGVGYVQPDGEWIYRDFTVNSVTADEELTICCEFVEYIQNLTNEYSIRPSMYHWSHAEPSAWNRAMLRHPVDSYGWPEFEWVDLLKVFHTEPVGVKGCLDYSLKNLAKILHRYGYIKTIWDGNSACADGADVAVGAYKIDRETHQSGTLFTDHPLAEEIIKYNEIDCKVLQEIITYLRENHISPNDDLNVKILDYDFGDSDSSYEYETEEDELDYFSDETN